MPYFGVDPDRYEGWSEEDKEKELENAGLPEESLFSIEEYREIGEVMTRPDCQRVLSVLGRRDGMLTVDEIVSCVRANQDEVETAVESLARVGLLRKSRGPDGEFFRASSMGRVVVEDGVEALVKKEWGFVDKY